MCFFISYPLCDSLVILILNKIMKTNVLIICLEILEVPNQQPIPEIIVSIFTIL